MCYMHNREEGTHHIPNGSSSFTLYASNSIDPSNMQQWKHLDCLSCLSLPFSYIQHQWNTIEYFDYICSIALLLAISQLLGKLPLGTIFDTYLHPGECLNAQSLACARMPSFSLLICAIATRSIRCTDADSSCFTNDKSSTSG